MTVFFFFFLRLMKTIIHTDDAPAAIGPYSQAVSKNGFVFVSGQLGLDPSTMELEEGIEHQTKRVLRNLTAILHKAGMNFENIIKVSIFLDDMGDFATVNEIYAQFFGENPPARECVAVKTLPKNALVEMSVIAAE